MADIVRNDAVLGGDPRIEGTRVGVLHVYELVVEGEHAPADVADQLDLTLGEVYSALAYYHEHPESMQEVRRSAEEADRVIAERSLKPPRTVE
jgi:uncharacterized protein (DUF433 family)